MATYEHPAAMGSVSPQALRLSWDVEFAVFCRRMADNVLTAIFRMICQKMWHHDTMKKKRINLGLLVNIIQVSPVLPGWECLSWCSGQCHHPVPVTCRTWAVPAGTNLWPSHEGQQLPPSCPFSSEQPLASGDERYYCYLAQQSRGSRGSER